MITVIKIILFNLIRGFIIWYDNNFEKISTIKIKNTHINVYLLQKEKVFQHLLFVVRSKQSKQQ